MAFRSASSAFFRKARIFSITLSSFCLRRESRSACFRAFSAIFNAFSGDIESCATTRESPSATINPVESTARDSVTVVESDGNASDLLSWDTAAPSDTGFSSADFSGSAATGEPETSSPGTSSRTEFETGSGETPVDNSAPPLS